MEVEKVGAEGGIGWGNPTIKFHGVMLGASNDQISYFLIFRKIPALDISHAEMVLFSNTIR